VAEQKKKAGRSSVWILLTLLFGPALIIVVFSKGCSNNFQELDKYGRIGDFQLKTMQGELIDNASLKGKITIFTTIQNTCPDSCGIDLWFVKEQLFKRIYTNPKKLKHVQIVSIVTDTQGNGAQPDELLVDRLTQVVKDYDPKVWKIASGNPEDIFNFEHNGINLFTQRDTSFLGNRMFLESLLLIDEEGNLRFVRYGKGEGMVRDFHDGFLLLQKEYERKAREKNKQ
jgi:cytochrome oxidase Cu insertion factor (SCO1/SenC/PrrC family)